MAPTDRRRGRPERAVGHSPGGELLGKDLKSHPLASSPTGLWGKGGGLQAGAGISPFKVSAGKACSSPCGAGAEVKHGGGRGDPLGGLSLQPPFWHLPLRSWNFSRVPGAWSTGHRLRPKASRAGLPQGCPSLSQVHTRRAGEGSGQSWARQQPTLPGHLSLVPWLLGYLLWAVQGFEVRCLGEGGEWGPAGRGGTLQ